MEDKSHKEEDKKEEPKKELSSKDKKDLLSQIKNLQQVQELLKMGGMNAIKSEYKFWGTQPVPQLNRDCETKFGPINKETNVENVKKEPYNLPEGFEWKDVDLSVSNEVDKLFEFLKSNYVGDESHLFGMEFSKDFLKWYLSRPNMYKEWIISVVKEDNVKKKKKMIGFISAYPCTISVNGSEVQMAKVSLLCVKKEFRNKRLTPVLIQELTRRVNLRNIWQGVYSTFAYLPKPFSKCEFYYRSINLKKLLDVKYTYLPEKQNLSRALKLYTLPDEPKISGFRKMEEKDLPQIIELIKNNSKKYKIFEILTNEEISHWFLPKNNIIYTYVLENENQQITDFCSFFGMTRTVINDEKYKKIYFAYSLININTTISYKDLLKTAIIFAKQNNFDAYHIIDSKEYSDNLKDLLFVQKIGKMKYYFYNFVCPETNIEDVFLLFIN